MSDQDDADAGGDARLDQFIAEAQASSDRAARDELAPRRALAQVYDRLARLTPEEAARMDAEMAVFADVERSLHQGREAFARGELDRAEHLLRVAAAHQKGDAVVYLVALHRRRGRHDLAAAWWTIAADEGFDDRDLREVEQITGLGGNDQQ